MRLARVVAGHGASQPNSDLIQLERILHGWVVSLILPCSRLCSLYYDLNVHALHM